MWNSVFTHFVINIFSDSYLIGDLFKKFYIGIYYDKIYERFVHYVLKYS